MRLKSPNKSLVAIMCLLLGLAVLGCSAGERKPLTLRNPTPVQPSPTDMTPSVPPAPLSPSGTSPTDDGNVGQLQKRLANETEAVPGVARSWVVLAGNVAMVGAELKPDALQGALSDTTGIKNDIMTRLQRTEPRLTGVVVTTDQATVNHLRQVAQMMESPQSGQTAIK